MISEKEWAGLTPGQIIIRRHDKSSWRVIKVTRTPRATEAMQLMMGDDVAVELRRVSPEFTTSHAPIIWDMPEEIAEEVA